MSEPGRRALFLAPSSTAGGSERALLGLARRLRALGWTPLVAVLESGPLEEWLREEEVHVRLVESGRLRRPDRVLATTIHLRRVAAEHGAEVVVANSAKGQIYGGLAALGRSRPTVWWQHGAPDGGRIDRVASWTRPTCIVCVSRAIEQAQRAVLPGVRLKTIHPGVPIGEIVSRRGTGRKICRELGWADKRIVGISGRLQPWKGQETFVRAAALLTNAHPDARFLIVGGAILGREGTYPKDLERLATRLGLDPVLRFVGHQSDPWSWMDAFDVAVHASVGEPFGLVIVEAMALGKPLVATRGPGPDEIVEDGVSGLLVPPGDPRALAASIDRVLREGGLSDALSAAATTRAAEFSEERTGQEWDVLLRELVGAT